jgi:hypothetical protein
VEEVREAVEAAPDVLGRALEVLADGQERSV